MASGFQQVLEHIRSISRSEAQKGRHFERLIKKYLQVDPIYRDRFTDVWLWNEWVGIRDDFSGSDIGVDLVAAERDGGYCAIQCKCYAAGTKISKAHLDSFIAASARDPFTSRLFIDTGDDWGLNAKKTIETVKPACTVLRFGDLASRPIDWPDLIDFNPEALTLWIESFTLRPHQQRAFDKVLLGFEKHDRGKLVMACGTGKTFTALRIAESVAGAGGRVLYLVPSISLLQQSMREWAEQKNLYHRYIGICSDTRAGRYNEDAALQELEIPVTTDSAAIATALGSTPEHAMTVVFCTYHSLGIVEAVQDDGAPQFDLVLCDEAHRTTGIEQPGDETSPFVLVHDGERIRTRKRLYMTATPRIYTDAAQSRAARLKVDVFSMDDQAVYGPYFHRLKFSEAIEEGLLSDYKVVVFALAVQKADPALEAHLSTDGGEIDLDDAAKIVGCWKALSNPENKKNGNGPSHGLRRAIAFTNTIFASRRLEKHFDGIVEQAITQLPKSEQQNAFRCETRHVDGKHNALVRKSRIEWLKGSSHGRCRILSNARCLTEGVDVPALDAVLFTAPRKSQVEIVQGVGRVMRKVPDKEYGYIVLPVTISQGVDPAAALDDNETYATVWAVLRALRSHDDRLDVEINQLDLNKNAPERIIIDADGDAAEEIERKLKLPFKPVDLPPGAIYAKIVERCGDRKYWETWAKDVAAIFSRLVTRIDGLLNNPENAALREWFAAFHEDLKETINSSITRESAVEMMAQHIITRPVFEALFEDYDFTDHNPVARALGKLECDFGEFGLENEIRDLDRFYESVRQRARGLDNSEARQRVLMELYEKFFSTAMEKDAKRLGIVYTPPEIVDFILASANQILRDEFGRSLSDEGVHVLDPFTGTGIFLVRLLQSALLADTDLARKYRSELHANELVLLAYYIAAIHIEEAYHGRMDAETEYEPFRGIVLTDTFNLTEGRRGFPKDWLPDNSERAELQQKQPIEVIVGNPPWSAGQRSSADDNPNVDYPEIERRVAATYAARSTSTNKNSLYDSYKMAIRWASDRIGNEGVVALVTNGSWITGNVDSGVRACLAEEFSSIYVVNLRGNQRTQGERSHQEGGKVFGQGSRAPVAITILIRNPDASHEGCRILYRDVGDYLTREEKLAFLREAGSIAGIQGWQQITSDRHHDWIDKRDMGFDKLYPMGSQEVKAGKAGEAVFKLYSQGYQTVGDVYLYNFSREDCAKNVSAMVNDYRNALQAWEDHPSWTVDDVTRRYSTNIRWNRTLKNNLVRSRSIIYRSIAVQETSYRPFSKQFLYTDPSLSHLPGILKNTFPAPDSDNRAICVPGIGNTRPFSCLVVDTMPDLHFVAFGQCFPRFRYVQNQGPQGDLFGEQSNLERVDNITDTALDRFRGYYEDCSITKDDVFDYVYGVLHAPDYRARFANDLSKELPRIPVAEDFHAFAQAGRSFTDLHLGYEACAEYPLEVEFRNPDELRSEHLRITGRKMKFAGEERSELVINDHVSIKGIPPEAHRYQVNGRTPLEWFIDRYYIRRDQESGIVNDPNGWFDEPKDLVAAIRRIVHLSVETVRITKGLPASLENEDD